MLDNIHSIADLAPVARRFRQPCIYESINPKLADDYIATGWSVSKRGAKTLRMSKDKPLSVMFEHRVWMLMYGLQFPKISGKGGANLPTPARERTVDNQIDVVAIDDEIALCIECKTAQANKKYSTFIADSARLASLRGPFAKEIEDIVTHSSAAAAQAKRKVASIMWTFSLELSQNDRDRAHEQQIKLFDEKELAYYEQLVKELGPAAKYQFLADVFANTSIPAMNVVVPAIRTRMGQTIAYTFPIQPSHLLRIAYVSHRSKGKVTDVDTYQRLIKSARLKSIREYIDSGGYFPTSIVVNIPANVEFQKSEAPRGHIGTKGDFGWLRLPSEYKSAWIIDGQHRLFSYAGSKMAEKSEVIVQAFSGLAPSQQAKLFVDINSKQKTVKQNLLVELAAELFWDSTDVMARAEAVISKTLLALDSARDSPFYQRILKADDTSTNTRCISLQTLTTALHKPEFFMSLVKKVPTAGIFWRADNDKTLRRAVFILKAWFDAVSSAAKATWDAGRTKDIGGIAMNDGVTIISNTLRSVVRYLLDANYKLNSLSDTEVVELLEPYARSLGLYFKNMTANDLRSFRGLRGGQGHSTGTKWCQAVLKKDFPEFNPAGLQDFMELEERKTSEEARNIVTRIEVRLHKAILDELKEEYGPDEIGWWFKGIPTGVRNRIDKMRNEQVEPRKRETLFNLIDFRDIVDHNRELLKFLCDPKGKKEKWTAWFVKLNEIRNFAAHPVNGPVPLEDVEYLRALEKWVDKALSAADTAHVEDLPGQDEQVDLSA